MKNIIIIIPILLLCSACSVPRNLLKDPSEISPPPSPQLNNIVISVLGSPRFSGIMGLVSRDDGLYYMLLDATGIKLLEAFINKDDSYTVISGINTVKQSSLPEFMSKSLNRIYTMEPQQNPCSSQFLYSLCRKTLDDGDAMKYFHIGPFTAWKVTYEHSSKKKDPLSAAMAWFDNADFRIKKMKFKGKSK